MMAKIGLKTRQSTAETSRGNKEIKRSSEVIFLDSQCTVFGHNVEDSNSRSSKLKFECSLEVFDPQARWRVLSLKSKFEYLYYVERTVKIQGFVWGKTVYVISANTNHSVLSYVFIPFFYVVDLNEHEVHKLGVNDTNCPIRT